MSRRDAGGRIRLRTALVIGLGGALLVGLLPAALTLERRLSAELVRRAHEELLRAPMVLEDRNAARAEALVMHAEMLSRTTGLADAIVRSDRTAAVARLQAASDFPGEEPVLVGPDGVVWAGPPQVNRLLQGAAGGAVPVRFVGDSAGPRAVALAPVPGGRGAVAGVAAPLDATAAATLAALTRSDVVVVTDGGTVAVATGDSARAVEIARLASGYGPEKAVHAATVAGMESWIVVSRLPGAGAVAFVRAVEEELAVIPRIRQAAIRAALIALLLALFASSLYAVLLARPVRQLAAAAGSLAEGDFRAPLPRSSIHEVHQVATAFDSMRTALAARLTELAAANRALAERGERLQALQTEIIQRDRLAASGRLVAELAHEIRNPVANVRNCIEVVRRRLVHDPEARGFADMAVEELLRMHRLSEQLLDLHRPSEHDRDDCDAAAVLSDMAALARAGSGSQIELRVDAPAQLPVAIPCDALKQVLLNLIDNAREAVGARGTITLRATAEGNTGRIEVLDDGPGIPADVLPTLFDPFVTTKGGVSGVGLGLFVAEGIARRYGGRLRAENRREGGARLVLDLLLRPAVSVAS